MSSDAFQPDTPSDDHDENRADFAGRSPLFPLPNVVHFPGIVMPLHIFEPRYRRMTADALAGDHFLSMALIRPDPPSLPDQPPEIHPVVCVGRIVGAEQLEDGRYYLALRGLWRARVLREHETELPYRTADLEVIDDQLPTPPAVDRPTRHRQLLRGFRAYLSNFRTQPAIEDALASGLSLASLCDLIAFTLDCGTEWSQQVLTAADVDARSELVWQALQQAVGDDDTWPPAFSEN